MPEIDEFGELVLNEDEIMPFQAWAILEFGCIGRIFLHESDARQLAMLTMMDRDDVIPVTVIAGKIIRMNRGKIK